MIAVVVSDTATEPTWHKYEDMGKIKELAIRQALIMGNSQINCYGALFDKILRRNAFVAVYATYGIGEQTCNAYNGAFGAIFGIRD